MRQCPCFWCMFVATARIGH